MNGLIDRLNCALGPAHVWTGDADMAPYLTEQRGLFRGRALAVVRPGSTEEVAQVVRLCADSGIAVVPLGGNTGLVGGGIPPDHGRAVVVSTERLTRIRALDPLGRTMTVEAGCVLADLQRVAEGAGLLFPLSLGAEGSCRIGGNLSTNAGGMAVLRYGPARDLVLGLEVVLPDGRVWNGLKALRKDNTGYDLRHLFIGAEGTLGIITACVLTLFPSIRTIETCLIAVSDVSAATGILVQAQQASGDAVSACELIPRIGIDLALRHIAGTADPFLAPHPWYVLLELSSSRPNDGLRAVLDSVLADAFEQGRIRDATIAESGTQRDRLWRLREAIPEAQKMEGASIKHDVAVATARVAELIERAGHAVTGRIPGVRIVAFGHLGDGNIHFNLTRPQDEADAVFLARWDEMNRVVHDIVLAMDGSISAEHGIGRLKRDEFARTTPGVELELMHKIKKAFDPQGLMNPGKVLPDAP